MKLFKYNLNYYGCYVFSLAPMTCSNNGCYDHILNNCCYDVVNIDCYPAPSPSATVSTD